MSSVAETLYLGFHTALAGDATLGAMVGLNANARIYDTKAPEGMVDDHLTIDSPTELAFETFGNPGNDNSFLIHIWHRPSFARAEDPPSMQRVFAIYKEINRLLHNVRLNIAGMSHVTGRCALLANLVDPDGKTRHGVVRYTAVSFA